MTAGEAIVVAVIVIVLAIWKHGGEDNKCG